MFIYYYKIDYDNKFSSSAVPYYKLHRSNLKFQNYRYQKKNIFNMRLVYFMFG